MLRISYTERKTNEEVLARIQQNRELLEMIRKRQLQFFGHQIRKQGIEALVVTGKLSGKRARGGQRITFLQNFDIKPSRLIHLTRDRDLYRQIIVRQTAFRRWH